MSQVKYTTRQLKAAYTGQGPDGKPEKHLTKQAYVDDCNINRIMDRAKHGASLSHLANFKGEYGDFSDWNEQTYENMLNELGRAQTIFNDLPAELRNEFDNNPGKFLGFVNDPKNKDKLEEIFPALAAPGKQLPDVLGGLATQLEIMNQANEAAPTQVPPKVPETTEGGA